LEHPGAVPNFNPGGSIPHPPLKFCIAVAGFRPTGPSIDALMDQGITTPTLVVIGVNDQIVVSERTQTLVDICPGARVEKHEGGKYRRAGSSVEILTSTCRAFYTLQSNLASILCQLYQARRLFYV
jgi:Serine hydrolase (FSH1)